MALPSDAVFVPQPHPHSDRFSLRTSAESLHAAERRDANGAAVIGIIGPADSGFGMPGILFDASLIGTGITFDITSNVSGVAAALADAVAPGPEDVTLRFGVAVDFQSDAGFAAVGREKAAIADGQPRLPAVTPQAAPADPLYADQWHFDQLGDIASIWAEFTGAGIHVGVYDDGVQYSHADLDDNYDVSRHVVIDEITYDGVNTLNTDAHGTSVSGLIAAEGNNGEGGVGVAYGASITGVNIFDTASALDINASDPVGFMAAVAAAAANFDVINNSWGSTPSFSFSQNGNNANTFAARVIAAWEGISEDGRDGLGTIIVKSSGNESRNSNAENGNSNRFTITIAAARDDGFASSYSNHGADILVAASAGDFASEGGLGIVTTDLLGTDGYNLRADETGSHDYTDDFGGTSASAPIVTGVVALMLDANAGLGWRDVQEILALGASYTGSAIGATTPGAYENGNWFFNGGSDWNGGGRHFSVNYGYGLANAYNSVRIAEAWSVFSPTARTSANEKTISASNTTGGAIVDNGTSNFSVTAAALEIEHIDVTLTLTHSLFTQLRIFLVAPDGKEVMLADGTAGNSSTSDGEFTWTFGVDSFRGVNAAGDWTVRIEDTVAGDSGSLTNVSLDFFGTKASASDVYHYTNEFSDMVALQVARTTRADTNGGIDWIDMAAVSSALDIKLTNGKSSVIDGVSVLLRNIENAIGGDGHDVFAGSAAANKLYGFRGSDQIDGGKGKDRLDGGAGIDTLIGGRDADILTGGKGRDDFLYRVVGDSLDGGKHDLIKDFGNGGDRIDLSDIDTRAAIGDQAFSFIGADKTFNGKLGELHFLQVNAKGTAHDHTLIEADLDGDKAADFQIELAGLHALVKADFLL